MKKFQHLWIYYNANFISTADQPIRAKNFVANASHYSLWAENTPSV